MAHIAFIALNVTANDLNSGKISDLAVLVGDPVTGDVTAVHDVTLSASEGDEPCLSADPAVPSTTSAEDRAATLASVHALMASMPCCFYNREWTLPFLDRAFEAEGLPPVRPLSISCLLQDLRALYSRLEASVEATAWRLRLPVRDRLLGPGRTQALTLARFCFEATHALHKATGQQDKDMRSSAALASLLGDLHAVGTVLETYAASRRRAEAPDFNALSFIGTDERQVSSLLAALLDPDHAHGQGTLFLARFMERFAPDLAVSARLENSDRMPTPPRVDVRTEAVTEDGRFIDILVDIEDGPYRYGIAIENKIWAGDQSAQVSHYLDWIERRTTAFGGKAKTKLVYLTPTGVPPSAASIAPDAFDEGRAQLRVTTASYGDIVEWLKGCPSSVKAPRVAGFIDDLVDHIRLVVLQEKRMQDNDALIALVLGDERKLETFLNAQRLADGVRSELLVRFIEDLGLISGGCRAFSSGHWDSNRYRVRLDLGDGVLAVLGTDYPNFGWVWYGLESDEPRDDIEVLQAKAAATFGVRSHGFLPPGGEPGSEKVRIWRHKCVVQGPMGVSETWSSALEPWLALQNGRLARNFVNWAFEAERQMGFGA